jgi:alpha-galactosidase
MSGFVGATPFYNASVAGTAVAVKAARGQIHAIHLVNTTGSTAFLQVHAKPAASVALGTDVPAFEIRLAANATFTLPLTVPIDPGGTGIAVAGTTTSGGSSGAAVSVFMAVT